MNQLTIYENAKHWISQYETVDEVKEYRDKAVAIQQYAKQANDYELETQAASARVRAERRCGELINEMDLNKGGRPSKTSDTRVEVNPTLDEMGLTHKQSSKWQQLANVPEDEFEDALNVEGVIPSAHGILNSRKKSESQERINEKSLYLWGRLIAIEKNLLNQNLGKLLDDMTPAMRNDSERIIPLLLTWLKGN